MSAADIISKAKNGKEPAAAPAGDRTISRSSHQSRKQLENATAALTAATSVANQQQHWQQQHCNISSKSAAALATAAMAAAAIQAARTSTTKQQPSAHTGVIQCRLHTSISRNSRSSSRIHRHSTPPTKPASNRNSSSSNNTYSNCRSSSKGTSSNNNNSDNFSDNFSSSNNNKEEIKSPPNQIP